MFKTYQRTITKNVKEEDSRLTFSIQDGRMKVELLAKVVSSDAGTESFILEEAWLDEVISNPAELSSFVQTLLSIGRGFVKDYNEVV